MKNGQMQQKIKHLYNRAGFGISYTELQKLSSRNLSKIVDGLFKSSEEPLPLSVIESDQLQSVHLEKAGIKGVKDLSFEQRRQRQEITRQIGERMRDLNVTWVQRMITSDAVLLEKMTLFWHGHFACRTNNTPFFGQQLNNIERKYALGNFKDLLIEVSRSAAMLDFLNNQQNKKGRPNENFARELMELFTLGRGNYSETDIKEAARAFTGWMHDEVGQFAFNEKQHDDGIKTFLGKTGRFGGEDIIEIILENPQTARFICFKLYVFFVNEVPDDAHIKELADDFYRNKYDIRSVMRRMLLSDWFYDQKNRSNKIKSPVEFLVGFSRQLHVSYASPRILIRIQNALGQYLFFPPNVAGWAGGKTWIDSSTLMLRMKIPSQILSKGKIDFSGKPDPDDEALLANSKNKANPKNPVNAEPDWARFFSEFPDNVKPVELAEHLLSTPVSDRIQKLIQNNLGKKYTVVEIVSIPEYQLC